MAGCDAHNLGGNEHASRDRILGMTAIGAVIGALLLVLGFGLVAVTTILVAAAAGAIVGFYVGSAIDWFSRLKEQQPRTITMSGSVQCAGRNPFGFQPISDGDWTCNLGALKLLKPADLPIQSPGAGTQEDEVRFRAAPGSGLARAWPSYNEEEHRTPILHCELSAHAGDYSVAAGAVGSVAGAAAGVAVGLAACVAAGILTFGIGAAVCALVVAILAAVGAFAGGVVGSAVGAFVGWVVDELSDFDKLGKTIEANTCAIAITGRWVTDLSHQHNEIHDIEAVQILPCDIKVESPKLHLLDVAVATIGRRPTGDNPVIK